MNEEGVIGGLIHQECIDQLPYCWAQMQFHLMMKRLKTVTICSPGTRNACSAARFCFSLQDFVDGDQHVSVPLYVQYIFTFIYASPPPEIHLLMLFQRHSRSNSLHTSSKSGASFSMRLLQAEFGSVHGHLNQADCFRKHAPGMKPPSVDAVEAKLPAVIGIV